MGSAFWHLPTLYNLMGPVLRVMGSGFRENASNGPNGFKKSQTEANGSRILKIDLMVSRIQNLIKMVSKVMKLIRMIKKKKNDKREPLHL